MSFARKLQRKQNKGGIVDQQKETTPTPAEAKTVRIVIEFAAGSVDLKVQIDDNVNPVQLLVATGYLDWITKQRLAQAATVQRRPSIAVPGVALPKDLRGFQA